MTKLLFRLITSRLFIYIQNFS